MDIKSGVLKTNIIKMKKLENFKKSNFNLQITDDELKIFTGGKLSSGPITLSKYICLESTSEGDCCDSRMEITKDYDNGTTSHETDILFC